MKNIINRLIDKCLYKIINYIYGIHGRKKIPKGYRKPEVWQFHTINRKLLPQIYVNDELKKVLFSDFIGYSTPNDILDDYEKKIGVRPEIRVYGDCGLSIKVYSYEDVVRLENEEILKFKKIKI